jgi:hypothetical protein
MLGEALAVAGQAPDRDVIDRLAPDEAVLVENDAAADVKDEYGEQSEPSLIASVPILSRGDFLDMELQMVDVPASDYKLHVGYDGHAFLIPKDFMSPSSFKGDFFGYVDSMRKILLDGSKYISSKKRYNAVFDVLDVERPSHLLEEAAFADVSVDQRQVALAEMKELYVEEKKEDYLGTVVLKTHLTRWSANTVIANSGLVPTSLSMYVNNVREVYRALRRLMSTGKRMYTEKPFDLPISYYRVMVRGDARQIRNSIVFPQIFPFFLEYADIELRSFYNFNLRYSSGVFAESLVKLGVVLNAYSATQNMPGRLGAVDPSRVAASICSCLNMNKVMVWYEAETYADPEPLTIVGCLLARLFFTWALSDDTVAAIQKYLARVFVAPVLNDTLRLYLRDEEMDERAYPGLNTPINCVTNTGRVEVKMLRDILLGRDVIAKRVINDDGMWNDLREGVAKLIEPNAYLGAGAQHERRAVRNTRETVRNLLAWVLAQWGAIQDLIRHINAQAFGAGLTAFTSFDGQPMNEAMDPVGILGLFVSVTESELPRIRRDLPRLLSGTFHAESLAKRKALYAYCEALKGDEITPSYSDIIEYVEKTYPCEVLDRFLRPVSHLKKYYYRAVSSFSLSAGPAIDATFLPPAVLAYVGYARSVTHFAVHGSATRYVTNALLLREGLIVGGSDDHPVEFGSEGNWPEGTDLKKEVTAAEPYEVPRRVFVDHPLFAEREEEAKGDDPADIRPDALIEGGEELIVSRNVPVFRLKDYIRIITQFPHLAEQSALVVGFPYSYSEVGDISKCLSSYDLINFDLATGVPSGFSKNEVRYMLSSNLSEGALSMAHRIPMSLYHPVVTPASAEELFPRLVNRTVAVPVEKRTPSFVGLMESSRVTDLIV